MRAILTIAVGLLVLGWVGAGCADAQTTPPSTTQDGATVEQLQQQIKDLLGRVAALESQSSQTERIADAGAPAPESKGERDVASELSAFREQHDFRGIRWRGFGEVNYKAQDQKQGSFAAFGSTPGSAGNFYTGDFDLFLTSKITEKTGVLAEVVIGEGDAQSFGVELARALLKYDLNEHLRFSAGRYHTAIGYYNTAFHSGRWLQTMVDRPLIMEFADDGGLLPTQAVGISVTGEIPSGKLGMNYVAEYGSSDTIRPDSDGGGSSDDNNGNHVNLGMFLRPEFVPGLQIGASVYHDRISDFAKGPAIRLGQTILNGHVVYVGRGFEILNEGFLIRDAYELGGPAYNMPAFYTQFSKRLGRSRPFFRYQYVNTNANSVYHDDILLRHGPSFGARYDFADNVAFKTQFDHTIRKGLPHVNDVQVQLSFAF